MAEKWIQKAINPRNRGSLHRELGVPVGTKIPKSKLRRAATRGGKLGKRARLALTLGKLRRGRSVR